MSDVAQILLVIGHCDPSEADEAPVDKEFRKPASDNLTQEYRGQAAALIDEAYCERRSRVAAPGRSKGTSPFRD